ncbi:hypothetical protein OS493_037710 [Desmophyllum pertusum]|uniref:ShKT domain-containing protein n=1 Tax=Desmophyllum pertusum TaxID=174260 RepID=A0A9W9ZHT3_9CNID|nr:hypothetical protein OS493_037710 [Desmophyllum pertusum]
MIKFLLVMMLSFVCECRFHKPGASPPMPPLTDLAIAKRGVCPEGGGDKNAGCGYWRKLGYCSRDKGYYEFMETTCPATCGLCQARPTEAPKARSARVNINECLQVHNSKRRLHGARPLTWDRSLARKAQAWAFILATKEEMKHAPPSGAGENLFYSATTDNKISTCKDAVEAWYGEVSDYPFWNPPNSIFDVSGAQIGHFTQVVWKSTKKLGVGIASIKRGFKTKTYIVARYTPPGNYEGRFKQEVGNSVMALK